MIPPVHGLTLPSPSGLPPPATRPHFVPGEHVSADLRSLTVVSVHGRTAALQAEDGTRRLFDCADVFVFDEPGERIE